MSDQLAFTCMNTFVFVHDSFPKFYSASVSLVAKVNGSVAPTIPGMG